MRLRQIVQIGTNMSWRKNCLQCEGIVSSEQWYRLFKTALHSNMYWIKKRNATPRLDTPSLREAGLWATIPYFGPVLRRLHRRRRVQWWIWNLRHWRHVCFVYESGCLLQRRDGRMDVLLIIASPKLTDMAQVVSWCWEGICGTTSMDSVMSPRTTSSLMELSLSYLWLLTFCMSYCAIWLQIMLY